MLRHERRLLIDCLGIGLALALLVIAIDVSGALSPMEDYLYDLRALHCQFFVKPPTDKLVHLDIDDAAIDVIGRFPWPRAKLAQILNELGRAGPKAIELDILLSEPEAVEYIPRSPNSDATTHPTFAPTTNGVTTLARTEFDVVDNDAQLASEMQKLGNVIVPATFETIQTKSPGYLAMVEELAKDLELEEPLLATRLEPRKLAFGDVSLSDTYIIARREAMARRLAGIPTDLSVSFEEIRAQLLPRTALNVNSGVVSVLREELDKFRAAKAFSRFSFLPPPGIKATSDMRMQIAPIRSLSDSAWAGAYVNYMKFGSPVVRTVPLLLEQGGRCYPQMGLAIACKMLDADVVSMRIEGNRLVIPVPSKPDLRIPLAPPRVNTDGFLIGNLMDVPWVGGRNWESMYDRPAHPKNSQHVPMNDVWQTCVAKQDLVHDNAKLDYAIRSVYEASKDAHLEKFEKLVLPPEDFASREKIARPLLEGWLPFLPEYEKMNPREMKPDDKEFLDGCHAIKQLLELTPPLVSELAGLRQKLANNVKDRAVLIGWTATSAIADFIPTSLHEKCPGVVVHGVVFNGIMTGELWARAPWWLAELISFALGTMTAVAVGFFQPFRALLIAAALLISYIVVNGIVLFDYGNYIVGAAGPLASIGVVWGGCTLTRVIVEATERKRITRSFGTYSDSKLVDYLLEKGHAKFEGENREVTVVFTDFANFTALSERMGEKIVLVLNELLGELVPVIRDSHQGYVNKFMGDGIMFFYNAPREICDHAADAVATVLDMQVKLKEFNVRLRERGLPELAMRGGIASGTVVVGDAGGGGRSDYTCLGDAVNLSSRLEGANKVTGTHTLINDRAAELLDGQFLVRPIGKIQAVGKEAAIMCFEPLAKTAEASDRDRELVELSTQMVNAFIDRRFLQAIEFANQLNTAFGESKLANLYRSMAQSCIDQSPGDDFDGRIVLTAK